MAGGFLGKHHSEESKIKISQNSPKIWLGKKLPLEIRQKMSRAKNGIKLSEEHKEKIGQANKGKHKYWLNKYFSEEHRKKLIKFGENNPNWKGGISIDHHSPNEPRYKEWRFKIFKRDNWTCLTCGIKGNQTGGYLEPHHIKSWAEFPEFRYEVANGQTLCLDCHKLTNNYKNKKSICLKQ